MNISEKKFESFCDIGEILYTRLTPEGKKTPDYEIVLGGCRMIVEIKELTPNDDEKKGIKDLEEKKWATWGSSKVGNRIRYKIDDSKRQIERLASKICPAILLLYDTRPFPVRGISPYEILVAMYGFETIDVHVPKNPNSKLTFGKHRFGKGKKIHHDQHNYISSVGVLRELESEGNLHIDLYNNVFSDKPLPFLKLLNRNDLSFYTIAQDSGDEFRKWIPMDNTDEGRTTA